MAIDGNTIIEIAHKILNPEQIEKSLIYWDKQIFKKGFRIKAGPKTINMPYDGMLVFIDLAPRYNWGHPCLYVLVDVKSLRTEVIKASFSPYSRGFPETVSIVLRYGKAPPHGRYFNIFDEND